MKITQAFTLEAAHRLPLVADGHRCKRMHGHSYRIEVELSGQVQPSGFVVDFFDVEAAFTPIREQMDHQCLNDILDNPTAENIAVWIWNRMGALPLSAVRVFETPNCWAEYGGA